MMKKFLLLAYSLFTGTYVFSQIGLNTPTPSAALDIVSKGTDGTTKALEINNSATTPKEMVTVLDNGNIGMGFSNPQDHLHLGYGNMRIEYDSGLVDNGIKLSGTGGIYHRLSTRLGIPGTTRYISVNSNYLGVALETDNSDPSKNGLLILRTGTGNVGINEPNPTAKLHVTASNGVGTGFRLVDGSQGAGKTLVSDANGNGSWQTNSTSFVGFSAYYNGPATNVAAGSIFHFDTTEYITSGTFSGDTWTVGESGFYYIVSRVWMQPELSSENVAIYINGNLYRFGVQNDNSPSVNSIVHLNTGDQISIRSQFGSQKEFPGSPNTYFSAYKVGN